MLRTRFPGPPAAQDKARARQIFNVARNFYGMEKYSKAVQYCKKAEGYID